MFGSGGMLRKHWRQILITGLKIYRLFTDTICLRDMLMYDERNSEGNKQKKKRKRGGPGARKSSNKSLSGNMLFMNHHSKD